MPRLRATSRRLKQELNFDCFIRELNCTACGSIKYACIKKGSDVAVHSFHISANSTGCFAYGDGAYAAKGLQEFPAPGCEHFPQQLWGFEADSCIPLRLAGLPGTDEIFACFLSGTYIKSYCFHCATSRCLTRSPR